ncbi:hypothetical protein [Rossellomorea vietnamensis]|uniref:hypothetical protein n=1 Tax=Rossellomorea vietnamensis TaxID=218284 RepID=UPI00077C2335|nr:hypothetical protein [Rossellomorea vietnamensis]
MKKLFYIFLGIVAVICTVIGGVLHVFNISIHDKYVEKIMNDPNFQVYIEEDKNDNYKYDYQISVERHDDTWPSPLDHSGESELIYPYTVFIDVNKDFKTIDKETQFELVKGLSQYLKGVTVGKGFMHSGYYYQIALRYFDPEKINTANPLTEWRMDVYDTTRLNGFTKEEWVND